MLISKSKGCILDGEVLKVDFFNDFITFLKYTRENTIKRTATGNISLADLSNLGKILKYKEIKQAFSEHKKFGWKIYTETIIQFIHLIRVLAEAMNLIYKRKGRFLLSKIGNLAFIVSKWGKMD